MATSLSEVLDGSHDNNGGTRHHFVVSATDRANLIAFLRSIDSKDVAPEVVADPLDQPVCPGATATFTASASGTPPPAIQWQQSTNGGSTFSDIIGATSSSLVFTVDATQNGNLYRAVFTNRLGTVTSRAAMLSVSLLVTSNPTSKTASAGATVSFTAAASGSPTPTVKWQSSSDGGATFSTINGANATTLTFMATPFDNGRLFRAVFTNACGSVNTSAATSTVRQFTDPTLLKGTTPIRAIHIQELRARVDEQRARFILPAFPWTDPTLTIVTTPVRAVHVTELREALRQAYVAANRTVPVYTDATVTGGVTTIKAVHIEQLRTAVVALE